MTQEAQISIELETWQVRQLAAYLPSQKVPLLDLSKIRRIMVMPGKGGCTASYKVISELRKGFEVYLTDTQIRAVKRTLGAGAEVVAVTISAEAIRNGAIRLTR